LHFKSQKNKIHFFSNIAQP